MTIRPLSRAEVRSLDARAADEFALPTLVLMENAGRGAAEVLRRLAPSPGRALILCGPGNNGGDGAVVARHLQVWGWHVEVAYACDPSTLKGDAAVQRTILERSGLAIPDWTRPEARTAWPDHLVRADWIIDGLFGTGLTRGVDGVLAELIEAINAANRPILALDLPSGLHCDTGQPLGPTVRATATATFVAPKLGFAAPDAAEFTGAVHVVEIGAPAVLLASLHPDR